MRVISVCAGVIGAIALAAGVAWLKSLEEQRREIDRNIGEILRQK